MDSVQLTDQQSQAVVKSPGTRVSLADIEANIAGEFYMTANKAMPEAMPSTIESFISYDSLKVMTVCFIVLRNGFTVIGKTAPADAQNFNAELGRKFAREDAIRQIWFLMGYALRDRLAAA